MRFNNKAADSVINTVRTPQGTVAPITAMGQWHVSIYDPSSNLVHEDEWTNLITDVGLNELLSATLAGGTQSTSWYVGLTDGSPTTAGGDTMGSHSGWTEVTAYDEAARPVWTAGSVSAQSVDNSSSVASFTINTDSTTVGGAFLVNDSTIGGTSGTLYSVGAFSGGDVTLSSGSTLEVTATFITSR